jgi:hypothetical protein
MVVHLIKRSAKKKRDFLPGVVFCLDNKPLMGDPLLEAVFKLCLLCFPISSEFFVVAVLSGSVIH